MPTSFKRRRTRLDRVSPRRAKESCLSGMRHLLTRIAERGWDNPPLDESFLSNIPPSRGTFAGLQWRSPSCRHFGPGRPRHRTYIASHDSDRQSELCRRAQEFETRDRMCERREQTGLTRGVFYQTQVAWFCPL